MRIIGTAKPQELANLAWSCAHLLFEDPRLQQAIATASMALLPKFVPQDHSNLSWAFAVLREAHVPLLEAGATAVTERVPEFEPQHLVNTAWAFATLRRQDAPLLNAIAAEALRRSPGAFVMQGHASLAWAFSRLRCLHRPLLHAVASHAAASLAPRAGGPAHATVEEPYVGMVLWALCFLPDLEQAWGLLAAWGSTGRRLHGLSLGGAVAACQRQAWRLREAWLLEEHLVRGGLAAAAGAVAAALLCEAGEPRAALRVLRALGERGAFNAACSRVWAACGGAPGEFVPSAGGSGPARGEAYAKELRLLAHVLGTASAGDVGSVCAAVEGFGQEALPGSSQWLKVAGGAKAQVLADAALLAPSGGVVLEVGTYCGYSSARLAAARPPARRWGLPQVVTVEVDAAHAVIARNVLMFAGLHHRVEVLTGHSEDVLPWLTERLRCQASSHEARLAVDFAFLDQRGSRYEADLAALEEGRALSEGAVVVADNVLKPGAPLFLWHVCRGGAYSTRVLSVPEFAMGGVEDWMTVSTRLSDDGMPGAPGPPAPDALRALDKKADRMRSRAHAPDLGGGGIGFDEWAGFAAEMSQELGKAGFSAHSSVVAVEPSACARAAGSARAGEPSG
ncbi:unnamed protein product [Prorocentrum cordatum]|uniref:catechol O-methyltransferase n=1 Tax=Prorocentrum cordatum TaxID=2364126 RepID=A0ABN9UBW9_9DINO|nr:unnamed protein product [Polarella glacialis]